MSGGGHRTKAKRNRVTRLQLRDGDNCCYCGQPMVFVQPPKLTDQSWQNTNLRATVEHLENRAEGGNNEMRNLRLAHRRCNNRVSQLSYEQKLPLLYTPSTPFEILQQRTTTQCPETNQSNPET